MPESKRFLLRLHPRLFEALRHWAEDDLRSINAQIEFLLTDQARRAGRLPRRRTRPPQTPDSPEAEEDDETSRSRESGPWGAGSAQRRQVRSDSRGDLGHELRERAKLRVDSIGQLAQACLARGDPVADHRVHRVDVGQ